MIVVDEKELWKLRGAELKKRREQLKVSVKGRFQCE